MEYTLSILWTMLETAEIFLFSGAFLTRRPGRKTALAVVLTVAAELVFEILMDLSYIPRPLQLTAAFLIHTVMVVYIYDGKLIAKVLIAAMALLLEGAIEALFVNGTSALMRLSFSAFAQRRLTYVLVVTAAQLTALLAAWLLYRYRPRGGIGGTDSKWLALTVLFPTVSLVMLSVLCVEYQRDADVGTGVLVFGAILGLANIALIYIINAIEKSTRRERELGLLRQRIELQAKSFVSLEESYRQQRRASHEFQRHINALCGLLERGEIDAALKYAQKLQSDRSIKNAGISSKNPIIDVILNREYAQAKEQGIDMRVRVNDLGDLPLEEDKLVVLLSNLLDNAIEACQRCEGKTEIWCSVLLEETLYISVRNTSLPVEMSGGEIVTSKSDRKEHGYGLPAIKYILTELGAEFTFEYSDGWFTFAAEIPI